MTISVAIQAQVTCSEQLRIAQRNFDDGLLENISEQLGGCMEDGFTKEEKINAYKLLIQTHLFSGLPVLADELMLEFLTEFPSYTITSTDPVEFVDLFNTYSTDPIFRIEVNAGTNFVLPLVAQYFGPANIETNQPVYDIRPGFGAEVNFIKSLGGNFSFSAGFSFSALNLSYSNWPYDYSTVTGNISSMYAGVPLAVRYNYNPGLIGFFMKMGVEPVYLINSSVDLVRTDDIIGREPISGTVNLTEGHNMYDIRVFGAVGLQLNLSRDQLLLSVGYKASTIPVLDETEYYMDPDVQSKYFFTEDNMMLNHAFVTFSYIRSIYNPKKKEE